MNDLSATDRCVKCGLCLPHCPTFALTENEADSPRGRISLMQAIDQSPPPWSPGLFQHLDRCLQCGACEAMCPSKVPFGELMDIAQARLESQRQRSPARRRLRRSGLHLVATPGRLKYLPLLLGVYRRSGMHGLINRLPGIPRALRRLNNLLPGLPGDARKLQSTPAADSDCASIHLFTGCMGPAFDAGTLQASQRVLQHLGFRVELRAGQHCCGALHQHNGDPAGAARLARANLECFAADDHPILVTASGCSAQLRDYATLYPDETARHFGSRVCDIQHFLVRNAHLLPALQPFPASVAVHLPCSQRNALQQGQDPFTLLKQIPGIELLPVNPQGGCCGAAGSYLLSQPELSDRLRDEMIEKIVASGARLLVTGNIGCSLQLQAGLREHGVEMEVLHPVALLERCLPASG